MSLSARARAALHLHPTMQHAAVHKIEVEAARSSASTLRLAFLVEGDLTNIVVPPPSAPRRVDFLWQHTCFEAFLQRDGEAAYHELNLSPSSEWAIYGFSRYREIESVDEDAAALRIQTVATSERLQLIAEVDLPRLSLGYVDAPLRVGMNAVLETRDGSISYWGLYHPPGQADFHAGDAFALRLPI